MSLQFRPWRVYWKIGNRWGQSEAGCITFRSQVHLQWKLGLISVWCTPKEDYAFLFSYVIYKSKTWSLLGLYVVTKQVHTCLIVNKCERLAIRIRYCKKALRPHSPKKTIVPERVKEATVWRLEVYCFSFVVESLSPSFLRSLSLHNSIWSGCLQRERARASISSRVSDCRNAFIVLDVDVRLCLSLTWQRRRNVERKENSISILQGGRHEIASLAHFHSIYLRDLDRIAILNSRGS